MACKLAVILPNSSNEEGHIIETRIRRSRCQVWHHQPVPNMEPYDLPLEDVGDFPLLDKLVPLYKTSYACKTIHAWPSNVPFPKVYQEFSYCGYSYIIKPFEIDGSGMGLFIQSPIKVTPSVVVPIFMPFCGPIYKRSDWIWLTTYTFSMATYGFCENAQFEQATPNNRLIY